MYCNSFIFHSCYNCYTNFTTALHKNRFVDAVQILQLLIEIVPRYKKENTFRLGMKTMGARELAADDAPA